MVTDAVKKSPKAAAASKAVEAKAGVKPEAKKVEAKADAKKPEAKKAPAKKSSSGSSAAGKIKVTQLVGTIARRRDQEATLIGLGLNKRHRSRVLEDTPSVRGMVYKVRHLVKVEAA